MTLDLVNYLIDTLTVKEALGVESADVSADSSIILAINAVSKWFNSRVGYGVRQRALSSQFDGNDLDTIIMPEKPIVSARVWIDQDWVFGTDTEIESSDLYIDTDFGSIHSIGDVFFKGTRNIKVTRLGGWETIPYDIQQAAIIMVKGVMGIKPNLSSVSASAGNVSYVDSIAPAWVLDVIERYRREASA